MEYIDYPGWCFSVRNMLPRDWFQASITLESPMLIQFELHKGMKTDLRLSNLNCGTLLNDWGLLACLFPWLFFFFLTATDLLRYGFAGRELGFPFPLLCLLFGKEIFQGLVGVRHALLKKAPRQSAGKGKRTGKRKLFTQLSHHLLIALNKIPRVNYAHAQSFNKPRPRTEDFPKIFGN